MTPRVPELAAVRAVGDELVAALGARGFAVGAPVPKPSPLRRTWLDTFDWRLHRAGLELEQVEADGGTWFELHGSRRHNLTAASTGPVVWPARAGALPAGAVRERVESAAGIRALIETARFEGSRATWRLLDEEAKTVARLHIDTPVGDAAPACLTVSPVRGYDREAGVAVDALVALSTVVAAPASCYEQSLAAAGRCIDASPRSRATINPETPAPVAMVGVLRGFLDEIEANVPGVLADIDSEFLHDLRVAVRRARSTVKLAGDALPALGPFAGELKWLGDATTPTRDLDVYLLGVPGMAERLKAARPTELDAFRVHLADRRTEAFARLAADLQSTRFATLVARWRDVTTMPPDDAPPGPSAEEFGAACLRRAYRKVVKLGSMITPWAPAVQLHTLRKRCKELRYLLEIFEPIEPPSTRTRAIPALKGLQDCLGEFQDSEVQAGAIRTFAAEMMAAGTARPATLLAMGELAARLDADQQHARTKFAGTFAGFTKATRNLHWTAGDHAR